MAGDRALYPVIAAPLIVVDAPMLGGLKQANGATE
jgi:hypothetical protein